ncbi:MAG: hypothetical protein AAAC47_30515 [Pararhizobium sp.]
MLELNDDEDLDDAEQAADRDDLMGMSANIPFLRLVTAALASIEATGDSVCDDARWSLGFRPYSGKLGLPEHHLARDAFSQAS